MTSKDSLIKNEPSLVLQKRRQLFDDLATTIFEHVWGIYQFHLGFEGAPVDQNISCRCLTQLYKNDMDCHFPDDVRAEVADRIKEKGLGAYYDEHDETFCIFEVKK